MRQRTRQARAVGRAQGRSDCLLLLLLPSYHPCLVPREAQKVLEGEPTRRREGHRAADARRVEGREGREQPLAQELQLERRRGRRWRRR